MLEDNDRISTWQVALMLFLGANATEVLKLPRTLMQEVGPAGWLSLIVSHFAVFVPILIMIKLGQRFEG
ncbi:MAG: hypothetical protein PHH90_10220, partial [Limnochordia bacterium]|nr:hypothetical protein [Limnochordia bacterium]